MVASALASEGYTVLVIWPYFTKQFHFKCRGHDIGHGVTKLTPSLLYPINSLCNPSMRIVSLLILLVSILPCLLSVSCIPLQFIFLLHELFVVSIHFLSKQSNKMTKGWNFVHDHICQKL